MDTPVIKNTFRGPEDEIQEGVITYLMRREWLVRVVHGSMFQSGFPDLYAAHARFGQRWIEIKNPKSYSFTPAQCREFPRMHAAGVGIWILVAATEDEYQKLWRPPNWFQYFIALNHDGCTVKEFK